MAGEEDVTARNFEQKRMMTPWIAKIPAVQITAVTAGSSSTKCRSRPRAE
jgi:hypothetical protein